MHLRTLVLGVLAGLLVAAPALAATDAAGSGDKACTMACCKHQGDKDAAAALLPQADTATPVRQAAIVWFMRPALIGDRILQGQYIIEHDNDRMARGEPCTHIYAANDRRRPVVKFHCTHLERPYRERATVEVVSTGDPTGLVKFTAFQFAGETSAHGVPTGR